MRPRALPAVVMVLAVPAVGLAAAAGAPGCGGADGPASAEGVRVVRLRRPEDRAVVRREAGRTVLDVTSPFGIGAATLCREARRWPAVLLVRFWYGEGRPFARLEGFACALAEAPLGGPVSETDPWGFPGAKKPLLYRPAGSRGGWRKGGPALVAPGPGEPVAVEVAVPDEARDLPVLYLRWVDVYR